MERTYKITILVPEPLYKKWKILLVKEGGTWQKLFNDFLKSSLKMRRGHKEETDGQ